MFNFILLSALMISTIVINLANASQDNNMCLIASKNVVFDGDPNPLTQYELKKLNLIIAEKVFERAKNGAGFSTRNYASWKNWYNDSKWSSGITGIYQYGIRLSEYFYFSRPYGLVFNDGSFAVGIIGSDVKYGADNWTILDGSNWGDKDKYSGEMFFDKNGRPVAITITSRLAGELGSGRSFIYKHGKWEYESDDDWHERRFDNSTESLDPHSPKFLIN